MARVITARRADTCGAVECAGQSRTIRAGESINYGGPGAVTHATCGAVESARAPRGGRRRYSRPAYERCTHEDYPCCGC